MPDYLEKAAEVVNGDRQEAYGHPAENFARIATMWSSVLGVEVTREQVALCMILLKASRLINQPTHADSWTDIAGYVATVGLIHEADKWKGWKDAEPPLVEAFVNPKDCLQRQEGSPPTATEAAYVPITVADVEKAHVDYINERRAHDALAIHKLDKPTGVAGAGIAKALTNKQVS